MSELVRIVTADEAGRLQEIGELTALAYLADGLIDAADPYVPQLRNAALRAEQAILLALLDGETGDGRIAGTITIAPPGSPFAEFAQGDEFELRMLAVSPMERGRGIGVTLTEAALALAVERGARRVVLSTLESMARAHRIYEKLGFVHTPERDWYVIDNADGTVTQISQAGNPAEAAQGVRLLGYVWEPGA